MKKTTTIFLASLLLILAVLSGCSERSIDAHSGQGMRIAIRFSNSPVAIQDWNYRLIVTGPGMSPLQFPLALQNGFLVGEFDVPAGSDRTFTIEVYEILDGSEEVIYSGSRTIDVEADVVNSQLADEPIILSPLATMIRLSPIYQQIPPGGTFQLGVYLNNIPASVTVSQISFQVYYAPEMTNPTSAMLHTAFPKTDYALLSAAGNNSWSFSVFDTTATNTALTDANGNAPLATISFSAGREFTGPSQILIDSVFMLDELGNEVNIVPFFLDESTLDIVPLPQGVSFGEPALERIIRDSLGLSASEPITVEAAGSLTALRARDKYLSNLQGLLYLSNLEYLNIGNNEISDITAIGSLTKLQWLAVDHNLLGLDTAVASLAPLSGLTSLRTLHLWNNNIRDLSPLQHLTNLTKLQAWVNDIRNLQPLESLTELDTLGLGDNHIDTITALENLTNLRWLSLENNDVYDITPLINNPGMGVGDVVYLTGNPVADSTEQIQALQSKGVIVYF